MEPAHLAARAVELAGAHLVTTVTRIPGAPGEQLCSLLADRIRLVPGGPAVFAALEGMPTDPRVRRVLVTQLVGLIEENREFAEELRHAVRNADGAAGIHNVIDGNFSGRTRIGLGGLILIIALVLGIGVTVTIFVTNLVDSDTTTGGMGEAATDCHGARFHLTG